MRLYLRLAAALALLVAGLAVVFLLPTTTPEKEPQMPRFEWTSTNSAPEAYPVELVRADLILADDTDYYVPDKRVIHHGWGRPGATHIVGEAEKPLPINLKATWFSYVENTFYEIDTPLPQDILLELANKGIESPQRGTKHAFDRLVFGFGPEGEGAVWFSAHSNMIDVFRFKGRQAQVEWTDLIDNPDIPRAAFIDMILEEALGQQGAETARVNGYQTGSWPRRQQRWDWTLKVSGASEISLLKFSSLNGEVFHFFDDLEPNVPRAPFGAPTEVLLHWAGPGGQRRSATLRFAASETLQAFEELAATGDALTLHVELSKNANAVAVTLETPDVIYEFEQLHAEIFSRE